MSIFGMMQTSISGMAAQSNLLSSVSDNIANSDTLGYKKNTMLFSTFSTVVKGNGLANTGKYSSGGVVSHSVRSIDEQGLLRYTQSSTDLAISGNGFFVVQDADGASFLTRAGSFVRDDEGHLVNSAGFFLAGFDTQVGGGAGVANGLTGLETIQINDFDLTASPTETGSFAANLPSSAPVVAGTLPSTNLAGSEFTNKTSLVVYDYLGSPVTLDIYLSKTAAETWEVTIYNQADASIGVDPFPYGAGPLATDTLTFDPTTGLLDGASITDISVAVPNGATAIIDLSGMMQFASDYVVAEAEVDGSVASPVESVQISDEGLLYAQYANGTFRSLYRIPLADVAAPTRLTAQTGTVFQISAESGDIQLGYANDGPYGTIISSAIELSNVDIAQELTSMIQAQRGFTANSKVFQTGSDILDVIVNLKR